MQKKYPPSARKLLEARKKGDFAKSRDSSCMFSLFVQMFCLYYMLLGDLPCVFISTTKEIISNSASFSFETLVQDLYIQALKLLILFVAMFITSGALALTFSEMIQVGVYFLPQNILKPINIGVLSGLIQIFDLNNYGLSFAYKIMKAFFLPILVSAIFCIFLLSKRFDFYNLISGEYSAYETQDVFTRICCSFFFMEFMLFLLFAVIDLSHERYRRTLRLRMDFDEFRNELKDSEGSKHIRNFSQIEASSYVDDNSVRRTKLVVANFPAC